MSSFVVPESLQNQRLDAVVAALLPCTRSHAQRLIRLGLITGEMGVLVQPKQKIPSGTTLDIEKEHVDWRAEPAPSLDLPLDVVYEDEQLLVIHKPAGMVVHPAPGNTQRTLVNAVLAHCCIKDVGESFRPGLVHRLDKDTSGLILVAKTPAAHSFLSEQFVCKDLDFTADVKTEITNEGYTPSLKELREGDSERRRRAILSVLPKLSTGLTHPQTFNDGGYCQQYALSKRIQRTYKAIVFGRPIPTQGMIRTRIGRHGHERQKMRVFPLSSLQGRLAVTFYKTQKTWTFSHFQISLVEFSLLTGRTHQIRVHSQFLKTPLVGDSLYQGARPPFSVLPDFLRKFPRQALHAQRLRFLHPVQKEWLSFEASFPADFQRLLEQLQEHA